MQQVKLDRIDRHILHDLQTDGRITNVELARRAGISAPPCLRRVRALEEGGYIRGYHADLEPKALGFNVTVFAQVGLSSQAEPDRAAGRGAARPGRRPGHRTAPPTGSSAAMGTPGSDLVARMDSADLTWLTLGAAVNVVVRNR